MHIVIGLVIAFLLVLLFARRNHATRQCRWRADKTGDRDGLRKYRCMACGAEGFADKPGPPRYCKLDESL